MNEIEYQEAFEHILSVVLEIKDKLRHIEDEYSFDGNKRDELLEFLDEALDRYDL